MTYFARRNSTLTLLLGVDRFMSEARAITNLIGNAVATVVVARWEGAIDMERARKILERGAPKDERLHPASLATD
jgi:aerobic C4-dicarboxylate transport protein